MSRSLRSLVLLTIFTCTPSPRPQQPRPNGKATIAVRIRDPICSTTTTCRRSRCSTYPGAVSRTVVRLAAAGSPLGRPHLHHLPAVVATRVPVPPPPHVLSRSRSARRPDWTRVFVGIRRIPVRNPNLRAAAGCHSESRLPVGSKAAIALVCRFRPPCNSTRIPPMKRILLAQCECVFDGRCSGHARPRTLALRRRRRLGSLPRPDIALAQRLLPRRVWRALRAGRSTYRRISVELRLGGRRHSRRADLPPVRTAISRPIHRHLWVLLSHTRLAQRHQPIRRVLHSRTVVGARPRDLRTHKTPTTGATVPLRQGFPVQLTFALTPEQPFYDE